MALLALLAHLLLPAVAWAEGSPQMRPAYADGGFLMLLLNNATSNNFAAYGATPERRMNFRVNNLAERVYIGFGRYKTMDMGGGDANIFPANEALPIPVTTGNSNNYELRFRIVNPLGVVVLAEQRVPTSGVGFIGDESNAAYNRSVAGPAQLVGLTGYNAIMFTPLLTGDYRIEFETYDIRGNAASTTVVTPTDSRKALLQLFDLTVASGAGPYTVTGSTAATGQVTTVTGPVVGGGVAIAGRLWSQAWGLNTGSSGTAYNGRAYPYATDGVVTEINFNGMRPFGFIISCNREGVATLPVAPSANFVTNRRSVLRGASPTPPALHNPLYPIFLQNPDPLVFPSGTVGCLSAASVRQCSQGSAYCINVTAQADGEVEVVIDLNGNGTFDPGTVDVRLTTIFSTPGAATTQCVPWNGLNGLGQPIPDGLLSIVVNFQAGRTNLPLYDAEDNPNGLLVRLVRPLTNACGVAVTPPRLYWDDTNVVAGVATDGLTNFAGCNAAPAPPAFPAPIPAGTVGCHRWTGRGVTGSEETVNTWWYVAEARLTIPFFNDNSLFDIGALFPGSDPCTFVNGENVEMDVFFSDGKYNLADLGFTIVPTAPGYSFANPTTGTVVVNNAAANANNGPVVVSSTLIGGVPAKRRLRLRYRVVAPSTVNDLGYQLTISTNACGSTQTSQSSVLCSVLLPIELVGFGGRSTEPLANLLQWQTASEHNNRGFWVQRSIDGQHFTDLAFVAGAGNNQGLLHYQFTDKLAEPFTYYYRLRQEDFDGQTSYSKVIIISSGVPSEPMVVHFDHETGQVGIKSQFRASSQLTIQVYTLLGVVVGRHVAQMPAGVQYLSTPFSLVPGAYIIEVMRATGEVQRQKVVY